MKDYQAATTLLCDLLEDRIVDGAVRVPIYTFADALAYDFPGVDWQTSQKFGSRYVVADPAALMLTKLARKDNRFYDLCVDICICNIDSHSELPGALSNFAIEVLRCKWKRPTKRGAEPKKTWMRDYIIYLCVKKIERSFDLRLTRNDASAQVSACDAVAEALTTCGCKTSYSAIKNLMVHPEKHVFRNEMQLIERLRQDLVGHDDASDWPRPGADYVLSMLAYSIEQGISSISLCDKK